MFFWFMAELLVQLTYWDPYLEKNLNNDIQEVKVSLLLQLLGFGSGRTTRVLHGLRAVWLDRSRTMDLGKFPMDVCHFPGPLQD